MNSNDRRYVRTRRNIKTSFAKLLKEKSFDKININEISELADINRSTFYLHYIDKYELLDDFIDDLVKALYDEQDLLHKVEKEEERKEKLIKILSCLYEEKEYFSILFSKENYPYFSNHFKSVITNLISSDLYTYNNANKLDYEFNIEFRVSAMIGIIQWWLTKGLNLSVEKMANNIFDVFKKLDDC